LALAEGLLLLLAEQLFNLFEAHLGFEFLILGDELGQLFLGIVEFILQVLVLAEVVIELRNHL